MRQTKFPGILHVGWSSAPTRADDKNLLTKHIWGVREMSDPAVIDGWSTHRVLKGADEIELLALGVES
jgi:hypothetical protein